MKFHIGDKFLVQEVECEIQFINQDYAWLFPIEDDSAKSVLKGVALARIDKKGRLADGTKAVPIAELPCGAV